MKILLFFYKFFRGMYRSAKVGLELNRMTSKAGMLDYLSSHPVITQAEFMRRWSRSDARQVSTSV